MISRNVGSLENTKLDIKRGEKLHQENSAEISEMKKEIAISENHLITIESYVDKYLPIRVQSHFSEVLGSIFEKGSEMH